MAMSSAAMVGLLTLAADVQNSTQHAGKAAAWWRLGSVPPSAGRAAALRLNPTAEAAAIPRRRSTLARANVHTAMWQQVSGVNKAVR